LSCFVTAPSKFCANVFSFSDWKNANKSAALFNDATILERIGDAAGMKAGVRALDVACGPGIVVVVSGQLG